MQMIMPYRRRRHPSALGFPTASLSPRGLRSFDASSVMRTDISQTEEGYELTMELPGFSKDEVQAELKDGYLIVSAQMASEASEAPETADQAERCSCESDGAASSEETAVEGNASSKQPQTWVRRERFFGSCQRSFYMGEDIDEEGISAKFENGLLKVRVPKMKPAEEPEQKKLISIEG